MQSLTKRKQQREYFAKVNSGEVVDMAVSHGLAPNGDVLGNDLKPVAGTAAKGYVRSKETVDLAVGTEGSDNGNGNGNGNEENTPPDYTKLNTHADLDAALGERPGPEGWKDMKVNDKQAWLAANPATTNPAGWQ